VFGLLSLTPGVEAAAVQYWEPRMAGAPLSVALFAVSGFFNGIGRTRVTLVLAMIVALLNAAADAVLVLGLGLGIGAIAAATNVSLLVGVLLSLAVMLREPYLTAFASRQTWRPTAPAVRAVVAVGVPTGFFIAVDLAGFALFQLIVVDLGPVDGAATSIVMTLTSLGYWPMIGLGLAATTLVGQSVGAGDLAWARALGNAALRIGVLYMAAVAVVLAVAADPLVGLFVDGARTDRAAVAALASSLLVPAAGYQVFDALNLVGGSALRGAGDVNVPTVAVVALSWLGFVPVTHTLAFDAESAWVPGLPQAGLGAPGAWLAAFGYTTALGLLLYLRWRSRSWERAAARATQ
jgi:MATE family multidrug resistance protein